MLNIMSVCIAEPGMTNNLTLIRQYFSVIVTWNEPVPLNGILSHYTIRYTLNGTNLTQNSTVTYSTISNLSPNMRVSNITISATTGGGEGPPSIEYDISTRPKPCM